MLLHQNHYIMKIYYDEKLPNYDVDQRIRDKFQNILVWVLIVTNSIFVGVLSDYWLYKTQNVDTYLEIVGVTGGIIKIFQVVNNSIGRTMIKMLKSCIKKENKLLEKNNEKELKVLFH